MKKLLLILTLTISSINCYSQILFEKGYYINNSNQRIDCLIKNMDWRNNPTEFEYKLSKNGESQKTTIQSVKEFSILNISKYIVKTVNIDTSSDNINNLSDIKEPLFKEEKVFLKVLIEGKANLYEYINGNLIRYFYNIENSNIEPLISKKYIKTYNDAIHENNRFRQQLWIDLKCPEFKSNRIQNINYRKKDLIKLFTEYNLCQNIKTSNLEEKKKKDLFNLTLRPRLNSSSLSIQNSISTYSDIDFGNDINFGFGVEAEFILPYNKNKWSILVEPTYQYFKSEKTNEEDNIVGGKILAKVDYSSIEIPVGIRHYLFLNENSKIFINGSFVFDLNLDSSIDITRNDGSSLNSVEISTQNNFALGTGYKYLNKYSLEMRYQTNRNILGGSFWDSDYKTLSFIFGYSIF